MLASSSTAMPRTAATAPRRVGRLHRRSSLLGLALVAWALVCLPSFAEAAPRSASMQNKIGNNLCTSHALPILPSSRRAPSPFGIRPAAARAPKAASGPRLPGAPARRLGEPSAGRRLNPSHRAWRLPLPWYRNVVRTNADDPRLSLCAVPLPDTSSVTYCSPPTGILVSSFSFEYFQQNEVRPGFPRFTSVRTTTGALTAAHTLPSMVP
jgi:hypothetical protein